jgi:hypothetical protein
MNGKASWSRKRRSPAPKRNASTMRKCESAGGRFSPNAAPSATPSTSARFAEEIRRRYPKAPADAPDEIAAHACQVHSNRIGRTAGAKDFDPAAIDLAVQAYIRHRHSGYDELLAAGADRLDARTQVRASIDAVLANWRRTE